MTLPRRIALAVLALGWIPTLAIVSLADLGVDRPTKHADDFVSHDAHPKELIERIERLLGRDYLAKMPGRSTKPSIHIDRDRFDNVLCSGWLFKEKYAFK